jgi:DNA-binding MarR family transcriptional regulator
MSDVGDSVDFCINDLLDRYEGIDPLVEGAVDRVNAISKHISRAFEETLSRHDISLGEYKLLQRLATRSDEHRLSAGDLSRMLMLSSGAMTNRLDRLEKAGWVRRLPDPRDRRGVLIELTPAGERKIDEAVIEQADRERDVLGPLTRKELTSLNVLLRKVLGTLEAAPEPAPKARAAG